ncbi:hypothetical protein ACIGEP_06135 [Microbacterium sp. NPDC077663]|uniref:hypothetical protein n=1 Tax=Microbacterium sp. NPDC077663 TaxID=3364189 RepID=UPI0037C66D34
MNPEPDSARRKPSRAFWIGLLITAVLVAFASIVLIILSPENPGMYFTLVGMICLMISCAIHLRAAR